MAKNWFSGSPNQQRGQGGAMSSASNIEILGIRIETIPDFLADHSLVGSEPSSRLIEHCRRWSQFVGALWSIPATYSLRFSYSPGDPNIEVHLLFSCDLDSGRINQAHDFLSLSLSDAGFSVQTMSPESVSIQLSEKPFNVAVEVRQFEESVSTIAGGDSGRGSYSVVPWWGPGGAFNAPFKALVQCKSRTVLNVTLIPTALVETNEFNEPMFLANKARAGSSAARSSQYTSIERAEKRESSDPQAEWLGRMYAANLRRLARPFIGVVHILSDDEDSAANVANALAATINEDKPFDTPLGEQNNFTSLAQVVELNSDDQKSVAQRAFQQLMFDPIKSRDQLASAVQVPPQAIRLRYLMDARGAASVFRFPTSVNSGILGLEVRQRAPDYHPGRIRTKNEKGWISFGTLEAGGLAATEVKEFNKHCLITGFTGSGKTNTVLHLLHQFWVDHKIPFLVIESAKSEYRGLVRVPGFSGLLSDSVNPITRVYTLGNELCAPFRLNPFELFPGVRLESHLARLQMCFMAAIPQEGPLPALVLDALLLSYTESSTPWKLTDVGPLNPESDPRVFPQISDFVKKLLFLVEATPKEHAKGRGYRGEVKDNILAFAFNRISPLLDGSKGRMFDTQRSLSLEDLMKYPTILELNDLSANDRSLVTLMLLTILREYRECNPTKSLSHITVVEEARNVLPRSTPASGDDQPATASQSVDAFCNMLSEIRSLGEGIIIADQSPGKLAPDAVRNTNVQIAHQLRDPGDRKVMGNAMLMSKEQEDFVGKLTEGRAATFYGRLERATFVQVPWYDGKELNNPDTGRGIGFDKHLRDDEIAQHMEPLVGKIKTGPFGAACAHCPRKCHYRAKVLPHISAFSRSAAQLIVDVQKRKSSPSQFWTEFTPMCTEIALKDLSDNLSRSNSSDVAWCAAVHLWPGIEGLDIETINELRYGFFKIASK